MPVVWTASRGSRAAIRPEVPRAFQRRLDRHADLFRARAPGLDLDAVGDTVHAAEIADAFLDVFPRGQEVDFAFKAHPPRADRRTDAFMRHEQIPLQRMAYGRRDLGVRSVRVAGETHHDVICDVEY